MKGSDLVTAYVTSSGDVQVKDRYAPFVPVSYDTATGAASYPGLTAIADDHNDWAIHNGFRTADGYMRVDMSRPLDTGDAQDRPIAVGPQRIVWAWGESGAVGYHGSHRGTGTIEFIPAAGSAPTARELGESEEEGEGEWEGAKQHGGPPAQSLAAQPYRDDSNLEGPGTAKHAVRRASLASGQR